MVKRERATIYRNKEKQTTTAVLNNAEYSAFDRVIKRLGVEDYDGLPCGFETISGHNLLELDSLRISDRYVGKVKVHEGDTYDESTGEQEAVKKAMNNHNRAFNKSLQKWQTLMLKKIRDVNPSTFEEAIKKLDK